MADSAATLVIKKYLFTHKRILTYLQKLSDEQIHWRPSAETHCIAWHAWHIARWVDYTQACLPGMTPELTKRLVTGFQIWDKEDCANRWGFDNTQLGFAATGWEMSDEVALHMDFPAKAELLDYIEMVFTAAEQAVKAIDDDQFVAAEELQPLTEGVWGEGTVGDAILVHITHENRHLGMMECLLGQQGQHGSAEA
jgi:uncharacterized damage-inducible protein DinB